MLFTHCFSDERPCIFARKIIVFNFNKNELSKLKSHSIKKKTDYTILIDENGSGLLKAEAEGQASVSVKK